MGHSHSTSRSRKQQQFREYRKGNRRAAILALAGVLILGVTIYLAMAPQRAIGTAELSVAELLPAGQDVKLPLALFADGHARFYRYPLSTGQEARLFVVRSSDGVVRAAFDACDVCYRERKGYQQQGDTMLCRACGRSFRSQDVNVLSGGCNPAPIQRVVEGDSLVLKRQDLDLGALYF
jgi:uncharacterized membrane protein